MLLGTGYSSINLATDNDYLRALGETGVLGFLALGLVFINIGLFIKNNLNKIPNIGSVDRAFICGVIGGIVGALTNAIFIDVFEASKFAVIFWLFMGMLIATLKLGTYEQN
jgi:O-antigen ligase